MKSVHKEIEVIAHFSIEGNIRPYRFKYETPNGIIVVTIDKVVNSDKKRVGGFCILLYDCQVVINGITQIIQIRYEINSCKWYISRI
jgi:hypothetical protein